MKVTILGGGFGLYGYLPALLQAGAFTIILPIRYQERFRTRNDISHFYKIIQWVECEENILALCEAVIIALAPMQQYLWVKKCLDYRHISHIFLEKPVAPTPLLAMDLINALEFSGKKFRVGYNFRYTDWAKTLLHHSRGIESIAWNFKAHHYAQNVKTWKRQHKEGGGALRFYGIHFIALLAELGYSEVSCSEIKAKQPNEVESWSAELTGTVLSPCNITVSSNCEDTQLVIKDASGENYSFLYPFHTIEKNKAKIKDQRIPFLVMALRDLFYKEQGFYEWYRNTNILWYNIETRALIA